MSKIGKAPINLPKGVEIKTEDKKILVKGPKGELRIDLMPGVSIAVEEEKAFVKLESENVENGRAYWGLVRALVNNAVQGVTEGFTKELEIVGVGYRVEKQGNNLNFSIGYSHPVIIEAPEGIEFDVPSNTEIKVSGYDRQVVGQVAANIRAIRKPEPYKGKGIKYKGEIIKRKQGKAAKAA